MHRLFKPKIIRRMLVFFAMMAPAVYLFGSLFFALNGAHGQEVFAEPVYTQEWVEVSSVADDGAKYRYVVDDGFQSYLPDQSSMTISFECNLNGSRDVNRYFVSRESTAINAGFITASNSFVTLISYYPNTGNYSIYSAFPWYLDFYKSAGSVTFYRLYSDAITIYKLVDVPTSEVPENAGAYSDYVFKNFFAKDNFLVEWGENAISETPRGFAPFGYFWRYIDNNMLHLSDDQMGLMAYGYMYYAGHVLLFDVGFILVTFFLSFIQRMADKFGGDA